MNCLDETRRMIDNDILGLAPPIENGDAESYDGADDDAPDDWPDPLPLPSGLPAVMPFDYELLSDSLRPWIGDIAERMQCPPDFCAATAMVMAGALVGRKLAIRPKCRDDWQCVPNLYGMCVGRPSMMKSPPMKTILAFMSSLEESAKNEHVQATTEYAAEAMLRGAREKNAKQALIAAVKKGTDAAAILADLTRGHDDAPPARKRYIVYDATVEKLGVILAENPNGVLVFRDELASLLKSMEREGHEADRGFYITAWEGDARYSYDRIGRGTLDIEAATISLLGSIQPGVVQDYVSAAVRGGSGDDGLIQRFQLAVWPDMGPPWRNVDEYPNSDARAAAYAAMTRLHDLTPADVDAQHDDYDGHALPYLRFTEDAQIIFDGWRTDLEGRLRTMDHPSIESHLTKYRSLIPSLALILHLLDGGRGPVGIASLARAIQWGEYLESHARRLYAVVVEASAVAARALAARMLAGDVADKFTARDIYRNEWSGLDRDRTEAGIYVLLARRWIEDRAEETAGRGKTAYVINPKIYEPAEPGKGAL